MHVHTTSCVLTHEAPYSLPRGLFPCYSQWLPVSLSRPIVLLQDLSSCRMTRSGHEVPVFTVQSPALNVVPLPLRVAEQYHHKFQMLCIAAASKANRPDGHWDYFCRPSRHRACAKHICVCRIHKVCVCVCVYTYVHLHVFTSAYVSIPPSRKEKCHSSNRLHWG